MKLSWSRPNRGAPKRCKAASPWPSWSSNPASPAPWPAAAPPPRASRRMSSSTRNGTSSRAPPSAGSGFPRGPPEAGETAMTSGTRRARASASQARPRASAANIPGGALGLLFTNSSRPSASVTWDAWLMSPPESPLERTTFEPSARARASASPAPALTARARAAARPGIRRRPLHRCRRRPRSHGHRRSRDPGRRRRRAPLRRTNAAS